MSKEREFKCLQNYGTDSKGKPVHMPFDELKKQTLALMPQDVINLNGALFLLKIRESKHDDQNYEMDPVRNDKALEARFAAEGITIDFKSRMQCEYAISWSTFYYAITQSILKRYEKVSAFECYPPEETDFILYPGIEPEDNDAIDRFIDFFNPESEYYRCLIKAMIVTPLWNGASGSKPCFIIAGPDGLPKTIQIGKSTLAKLVQLIFHSYCDLNVESSVDRFINSVVQNVHKPIYRIDNLKKMDHWSLLERFLTAPNLQGHRMHLGDLTVPNKKTWIMTANLPRLTPDMITRGRVIRLKVPIPGNTFVEQNVTMWIKQHRKSLIANVLYYLQRSIPERTIESRYGAWETQVLHKVLDEKVVTSFAADQKSLAEDKDSAELWRDEVLQNTLKYYSRDGAVIHANIDEYNIFVLSTVFFNWYSSFKTEKVSKCGQTYSDIAKISEECGFINPKEKVYINKSLGKGRGYWLGEIKPDRRKIAIIAPYKEKPHFEYFHDSNPYHDLAES